MTETDVALFDPARHTSLSPQAWDEAAARAAIRDIADDALAHFDPEALWPSHPLDGVPDGVGGLYMGGTGVILALDRLKEVGAVDYPHDFRPLLPMLAVRDDVWLKQMPLGASGSLLMSDLGAFLLAMRLAPDSATGDRVYARAADNNTLPLLELMWGTPGSMLACLFMAGRTGEGRWEALYRVQAGRLLAGLEEVGGVPIWVAELYGLRMVSLGLVHGFAGNMLALLRGWHWLDAEQRRQVEAVAMRTLNAAARRSPAGTNWPTNADQPDAALLCQICHGAPGIVLGFGDAPFSTPDFERLLTDAGALIWAAGPLAKGSNLCHGTAGNGYAFLALYKRTGDPLWLGRARAFAMTAIAQIHAARAEYGKGRYTLWTGDIGAAVYLWDCIRAESAFPSLEIF